MGGYIGSKGVGIISGIDASIADLNLTDKAAANGVTEANKVLTADANKDVTAIRNLTATGDVTANSAAINANGSGGTTGIHVNKNDINGYYFQAEFDGGTNNNRTYNLKPPSSDSSSEPFIWSTGNSHAWEVDGSEVLRIGSSKAIGLSGANYGTSGQVLTSAGSGAAPSWADAGGGGEQEFTATGAITAGQIVGIIPDGTISTFSPFNGSLTSSTTTIGAQLQRCGITYDTNANKLIIASARANNSPYYGYVQVCTIAADNTISIASEVAMNSAATNLARPAFDPATGRTNIFYVTVQNNPQTPHAISGIVSGNSMTFGSAATGPTESGDINEGGLIWLNVGSNKTLAVYRKNLGSGNKSVAYVITTSGTSVSWGSAVVVDSTTSSANQRGAVYDPDTNKVVIFYVVGSTSKCVVGTVSGTSISFGTAIDLSATVGFTGIGTMYPVYDTNANKVVFGFPDSANGNLPTVLVGTVSGTTISFGNPTVVNALETCGTMGMAFNSNSNTVELNYTGSLSGSVIQTVKVSGTVVVSGPIRKIPNDQVVGASGGMIYDPDTSRVVVVNSSNPPGAMVINPSAPTYVGIAKDSISNGAAGKVTVAGGINESQSSLIAGFDYGLPTTGSAVAAGPANKIGKAISATKLYISEGST